MKKLLIAILLMGFCNSVLVTTASAISHTKMVIGENGQDDKNKCKKGNAACCKSKNSTTSEAKCSKQDDKKCCSSKKSTSTCSDKSKADSTSLANPKMMQK